MACIRLARAFLDDAGRDLSGAREHRGFLVFAGENPLVGNGAGEPEQCDCHFR
jgi:hypothetical protein